VAERTGDSVATCGGPAHGGALAALALALLLAALSPAGAQEQDDPAPDAAGETGVPDIDSILQGEDEILITGLFDTPRGWVVQVRASDQGKSFLLREGDALYDGEVVSIGRNEVVFRQVVEDQAALKPFQEVVKKLNP
jgi:hypothetical protein